MDQVALRVVVAAPSSAVGQVRGDQRVIDGLQALSEQLPDAIAAIAEDTMTAHRHRALSGELWGVCLLLSGRARLLDERAGIPQPGPW